MTKRDDETGRRTLTDFFLDSPPVTQKLPFDVSNILSTELYVYGYMGDGPLIETWVEILGNKAFDLDGNTIPLIFKAGRVVGHTNESVVVELPIGYVGWMPVDQIRILNVIVPENDVWIN